MRSLALPAQGEAVEKLELLQQRIGVVKKLFRDKEVGGGALSLSLSWCHWLWQGQNQHAANQI